MNNDLPAPVRLHALGTTAVVAVTERKARETARDILMVELDEIDRACSRFRDDSDLARVNAAAGAAVPVSAHFLEALVVALRAARTTDGVVDPTVGTAMRVLGYDRDFASIAADSGPLRVRVRRVAGWQSIELDENERVVRVPRVASRRRRAPACS